MKQIPRAWHRLTPYPRLFPTSTRGSVRAILTGLDSLLVSAFVWVSISGCTRDQSSDGETVARTYCGACHAFPEPQLLDKRTWQEGVLPQMAPRLGVPTTTFAGELSRNPQMIVLPRAIAADDWKKIVAYYQQRAPDSLPYIALPVEPQIDPAFFRATLFAPGLRSSGIITLLKADSVRDRIFVGEAVSNTLRVFDWKRHLLSSLTLDSPPTDLIVAKDGLLVLQSGILSPNDEPRGSLVQYDLAGRDSLRLRKTLIDSLFRPVLAEQFDFDGDGVDELVICEFGDNRGRLSLYRYNGSGYERQILDPSPGAIRLAINDMTGDGAPDIVALFAQADERIVLFENDGKGHFTGRQRLLARFPPVYGSAYFSMHDFNNDGRLDILYVNGDNYDYSRVLKPYHGIRILKNDGKNNFSELYFWPMYGAARAEVADFDKDGDLDILAVGNFADSKEHPERGIMFLENTGPYTFRPYAFTIASRNQWNVMAMADLNRDGRPDVIIGAMDLGSVARMQRAIPRQAGVTERESILVFENEMRAKTSEQGH
jgi:hypothetical protein